jgi:hypothetical protein
MVNVPVLVPLAVGSKNTPTAQLAPAATVLPHALSEPKSAGLVATLAMVSAAVPVLVRVTLCGRPEVPTYWAGKLTLVGDKLAAGAGGVLPLKATACGLPGALSVTLTDALRFPPAIGVKVTLNLQLAFTAREELQALVCAKSPAFAPVTVMFEIFSVALPVLVRVTVWGGLVVPMACCAKVRSGGPA